MKAIRLHTVRVLFIALIGTGIVLSFIQPLQSDHVPRSFANWLDSVIKKENDHYLTDRLEELEKSRAGLHALVEQASIIISKNNDDFNLPLRDKEANEEKIYNLLLSEWDSYRLGNAMATAPLPETVKTILKSKLTVDKLPGTSLHLHTWVTKPVSGKTGQPDNPDSAIQGRSYFISPLSGGIAIGAP